MKKKLKVLIVHNFYQIPGGEDSVVKNEKEMLIENGHDVLLYTRHNNEINKMGIIRKVGVLFESIFSIKTYNEVTNIIKKEKIDIVHVHNTLSLISPSVYYAAFKCNVPVIQTIHNFRFLCPKGTFARDEKICEECIENNLLSALTHRCYRNSVVGSLIMVFMLKFHRILGTYKKINGYITLTEFNKEKLSVLIKDKSKIYVKPNFVKKVKDEFVKREIKNYFVFIGRLDKLKGINLLVEAWREIKDTELYIIGDGPEHEAVQNYIKEKKSTNIKLLGFLTKENAFKIIENAKAIIVPSQWYEGFPMTIVESFSLGVPVIAGDIGNLSSIVENEKNGVSFIFNSKEDLIDKVNYLNSNEELDIKLSINAYDKFARMYTDKINYEILNHIYMDLIKGDNCE
jgi:glycosyltransferase involved in cell wall biosynthesis